MLQFISGMQTIENGNGKGAEDKLIKAAEEAEKGKDKEEMAITQLGLGYCYSFDAATLSKAIDLYTKSLELWKSIHTPTNMCLVGLLADMAVIQEALSKKPEAVALLEQCQSIYSHNKQDKESNPEYKALLGVISKVGGK
eukprot:gene8349-9800_t